MRWHTKASQDATEEGPINRRYRDDRNENQRNRTNDKIRVAQVRLIDQDRNQIGVVGTEEALQRAQSAGLDLVEIAPNAAPPVCRIMDYGKFLYEQQKKQKDAKKNQHTVKVKEIKLSPRISDHDYEYRMEQAKKFLEAGDRIKLTIVFRGREMSHKEFGLRLVERFEQDMSEHAIVDKSASFAGRNLIAFFVPKK